MQGLRSAHIGLYDDKVAGVNFHSIVANQSYFQLLKVSSGLRVEKGPQVPLLGSAFQPANDMIVRLDCTFQRSWSRIRGSGANRDESRGACISRILSHYGRESGLKLFAVFLLQILNSFI